MMRAFFCIPIPDPLRGALEHLGDHLRSATRMRANWVPPQNYHITLRFLGDIDLELVTELEKLCRDLGERIPPFQCILDRVGAFPTIQKARVLWVGGTMTAAFQNLVKGLSSGLIKLGFPQARSDSVVHATLARIKDRPDSALPGVISGLNPIEPMLVSIDRIVLMESVLTGRGAIYTPRFTAKLVAPQL